LIFYHPLFFPSFSLMLCPCFFLLCNLSQAYPNLIRTNHVVVVAAK
jgi:hypothetical protein